VKKLAVLQPRDDYREILELAIIFLGGKPPRGISFGTPGALHRARWMAKISYELKMWMFKSQFQLNAAQVKRLMNLNLFIVEVYLEAPFPSYAPAVFIEKCYNPSSNVCGIHASSVVHQ
jgi:hypothetical protein